MSTTPSTTNDTFPIQPSNTSARRVTPDRETSHDPGNGSREENKPMTRHLAVSARAGTSRATDSVAVDTRIVDEEMDCEELREKVYRFVLGKGGPKGEKGVWSFM